MTTNTEIKKWEPLRKWAKDAANGKTDKIPYIDITDLIAYAERLEQALEAERHRAWCAEVNEDGAREHLAELQKQASQSVGAVVLDERKAFEKAAVKLHFFGASLAREVDSYLKTERYIHEGIQACWLFWNERAALASQPVTPVVVDEDLPPLTMTVYGTRTELELERARRLALAAQTAAPGVKHYEEGRKQGRAEALAILMQLDPETGIDDYTGWSMPVGPEDEGSAYWDGEKLRALFAVDGALTDMMDQAEAQYWQYIGMQGEAECAKNFAANMHGSGKVREILAKAGEFDLMGRLCSTAAPAPAAPVSLPSWLIEIGKKLRTQDEQSTADAMFIVERKRIMTGLDTDYSQGPEDIVWSIDGSMIFQGDEEFGALEAGYENDGTIPQDFYRSCFLVQWEFVTAFFTDDEAKQFASKHGHKYGGELRIMVEAAYRNDQWKLMREWLLSIGKATDDANA